MIFLFKNQESFLSSKNNTDKLVKELLTKTNIDKNQFEECMQANSTTKEIKQSALAGDLAKIKGTPSFFINGKQLPSYSFKLLILQKIYDHLQ